MTKREQRDAAIAREREQQHDIVDGLQQVLLPTVLPRVPGVSVAARYRAAAGPMVVGGDWYAVVPLPGGRVGLAIGDVAGHGLPAVADMADARFSLRALALGEPAPERVLARLNEVMQLFEDADTLITALYGVLDPKARTWSFANAGHYPPVLRCADGSARLMTGTGELPLGVQTEYTRHDVQLEAGATLILYTDGLIERRSEPVTAGLDRLVTMCATEPSSPVDPEALCDELIAALVGPAGNDDDVAVVVATLT